MYDEFYEEYYQNMDAKFIEWRKLGGIIKAENIINIGKNLKFNSVLEIGCGTGIILNTLSERGFADRYYAIDISESAIEFVKKQKINGLIEVKKGSALEIPYEDKNFDLAIVSHILEHLDDPQKALLEAKRVANYVIIEIPLEDNIIRKIKILFFRIFKLNKNYALKNEIGHVYFFNRNKAIDLVKSCGLQLEDDKIIYLQKNIMLFNVSSLLSKIKVYLFLFLQSISKVTSAPLTTTHFIMLCKSDADKRRYEK